MLIAEQHLGHWIENFYGYGSWKARFWFVGYEESGGDVPEEVAEKINYFFEQHQPDTNGILCNIRELYQHVSIWWEGPKANIFTNRFEYRFSDNAILNAVWKNLVAFEYGHRNEELPDTLEYQRQTFASPSANNEALIKLYPLPAPHNHAWYYSWLDLPQIGFLKSRPLYEQHLFEPRLHNILSNIRTYNPEVVLMYGMNNINALKKSVEEFFHGAKFKMMKATKGKTPQYHHADFNGTTMLITTQYPALRHNRVETGFDWRELGKRIATEKRPSTSSGTGLGE